MAMQIPAVKEIRKTIFRDLGIPLEVLDHVALKPKFDSRDTERVLAGSGIEVPPLDSYADALWDYWERNLDPDLFKDRSLAGAIRGKKIVITGGSSGIGYATALRVAEAGAVPILVARGMDKLEEAKKAIEDNGGEAHVYSVDLSSTDAIEEFVEQLLKDHDRIDMLVNNAGRSIRRGVMNSLDRFHDYERTMQLNYYGAIKMITGLLPHWKENGGGHVVNVSSIGAQTYPPRFAAYIASKAALDGWTACAVQRGRRLQHHLHHGAHAAGEDPDDRADQDLRRVPDHHARTRPRTSSARACARGRRSSTPASAPPARSCTRSCRRRWTRSCTWPTASSRSRRRRRRDKRRGRSGDGGNGSGDGQQDGKASNEAFALAHLLKGVHW